MALPEPVRNPNGKNGNGRNGFRLPDVKTYGSILQTVTVVGVALSGLYAGIIVPINEKIQANTAAINANAAEAVRRDERVTQYAIARFDKLLSKEAHAAFVDNFKKDIQDLQRQITELRGEINLLREKKVPLH